MKIQQTVMRAVIGSGYTAEIVRDTPAGHTWGVWMPLRDGQGNSSYTPHKTLRDAKKQIETAEDFGGWKNE